MCLLVIFFVSNTKRKVSLNQLLGQTSQVLKRPQQRKVMTGSSMAQKCGSLTVGKQIGTLYSQKPIVLLVQER